MEDVMLTTIDNPFNPHTDWEAWYAWDVTHGYHTCEYLARIVITSYDLGDGMIDKDIDDAIDEIVSLNINGKYAKVTKEFKFLT